MIHRKIQPEKKGYQLTYFAGKSEVNAFMYELMFGFMRLKPFQPKTGDLIERGKHFDGFLAILQLGVKESGYMLFLRTPRKAYTITMFPSIRFRFV